MLGKRMTAAALFGLAMAVSGAAGAAGVSASRALVEDAYRAMGMSDVKLSPQQIVTLTTHGTSQTWDPGESISVSDPYTDDWGISTFTQTWDRSRGLFRIDWMRPIPNGRGTRTYTEIVTDEYSPDGAMGGYIIGKDVNGGPPLRAVMDQDNRPLHTESDLRLTATLRELQRNNVIDLMYDFTDRVSAMPNQMAGGRSYPAAQYRGDYGTFTVLFDPASKLPVVIRTRDWDPHMGDADFDATLSDWRDIGEGVKMPYHRLYTLNGIKIFDVTIDELRLNPPIAADTFAVPPVLRGKASPPATIGKVPYQWMIRRPASGYFLDSGDLYTDEGGTIGLVDLATNISMTTGGSHNTLIVEMDDYLVGFDAPGDDGLSNKVIQLAAERYPGKPFRYVLIMHHHIDHTGGIRAYVAQGASLVVAKGNGAYFRNALAAPAGLNPYPVTGTVEPRVIEVDGKWSVSDGNRMVDAYEIVQTEHTANVLIAYIPDAKLGWVTDLWNPGGALTTPLNPNVVDFVNAIRRFGIEPERFAGGHGSVANYSDAAQAVDAQAAQ